MKKRFLKRLGGKRRGFTLIELLIVLSILAVLAAVVVLALTGFIGRGETAACDADEQAIQTAVYAFYYENSGDWPTADDAGGKAIQWSDLVPTYLNETPDSDATAVWGIEAGGQVCCNNAVAADCPCGTACTY